MKERPSAITRFAVLAALVSGLGVPVVILTITYFSDGRFLWNPYIVVALWPSSIMLMGTMGQEFTPMGIIVLAISVLLNQILYFGIGALVGYFYYRGKQ